MAIEHEIPKDIKQYEPKLMGPFTARQVFCLVPALGGGVAIFWGLRNILPTDIRFFLITIVAVPFFLLGWLKPYGLPLEKFIKSAFISMVLSPPFRKYKTQRIEETTTTESETKKSKKTSNKKRKKKSETDPLLKPYL